MDTLWKRCSSDYNRFIQRFRRFHKCKIHYIRTIESHQDCYPHIHAVLQFPMSLSVDNARYLDRQLFREWEKLWTFGHTDFEPVESKSGGILYITKYVSKGSTSKTIWKKVYALQKSKRSLDSTSKTAPVIVTPDLMQNPALTVSEIIDAPKSVKTAYFCKKHKIRQCSWSRGFVFPVLRERSEQTKNVNLSNFI